MAKDYYAILGITKSATDKDIKQAFRRQARRYHPDFNPGDKTAEAKFKELNEANEVLADPEKRRKYDQYGENWQYADQFAQAGAQQPKPEPGGGTYYEFSGTPFAQGDMSSVFEDLLSGMGTQQRAPPRTRHGQDVEYPLEVTLEEAFQGTLRTIQLQSEEVCKVCGGKGALQNAPCYACRGSGRVRSQRTLEVKIPPGVKTGSRVRIAGAGGEGYRGGTRGDLYLIISVKPHALFERKEDDLYVEVGIPLAVAMLGGDVKVPILRGKIALKVPPETQNGQVFRLSGQGMPHLGNTSRGDIFAKMRVVLPTNLNHREKELFEQLKTLRPA